MTALENLDRCISQDEIDRVADAIVAARKVFVFALGARPVGCLLLPAQVGSLRDDNRLAGGRGRDIAERVVSMGPQDIVVALAFRQQPGGYAPLVERAAQVGARTVLVSDLIGPTMEPVADVTLAAPRGRSGSEFQHARRCP